MKNKKLLLVSVFFALVLAIGLSMFSNLLTQYEILKYVLLGLLLITGLITIRLVFESDLSNINSKDKLYKFLVQNLDTLYIMINKSDNKVLYMSSNVEDILGIKVEEKNKQDIVYKILNLPVVKVELNKWDKISNYVSGMIEYDNPKYNYRMWIRVKIYPYKDKKETYYIIQITDATKEHDRQHLLISQATNIKSRESVLNQITEKSYDFEITLNLTLNSFELKYFKKDNLYFGEEKRGLYTEELKRILNYINESDRDLVYSNLNIDTLKEHFLKYELDSVSIRYRVGDIKNVVWLESTIFFITDRQKNLVSILTKNVTQDATSIREQNVMLQNALNEARYISKSKTDLISTISMDVRTPLTNIVGISDSLLSEELNHNLKEDIKNINDSSKEVLNIIDGLLDTSKIEKRLLEKDEANYSILKMFKVVENCSKEYLGNKQIKLNFNLDSNLPVILYGDYRRITRALNEVINNAIKYTDEGTVNVSVRGEKINNRVKVIVDVSDTGNGINEKELDSIMNNPNNKGINRVKKLMNLLDGSLQVESKEGEYTKVTIEFMQKIVEDNKVREMIKVNKEVETFSLSGKNVLVVDDNTLNLKVTAKLLSSYDLNVVLVQSGQECIEKVKEQKFDLILIDQMMPGLDGLTTLTLLKQLEDFKTPVVVLTADAMQGQREMYINSGFDDYISKPIDKKELSRVLKKFVKES